MITACAKDFNNNLELKELLAFYEERLSELGTAKRDVEIAIQVNKFSIMLIFKNMDFGGQKAIVV